MFEGDLGDGAAICCDFLVYYTHLSLNFKNFQVLAFSLYNEGKNRDGIKRTSPTLFTFKPSALFACPTMGRKTLKPGYGVTPGYVSPLLDASGSCPEPVRLD